MTAVRSFHSKILEKIMRKLSLILSDCFLAVCVNSAYAENANLVGYESHLTKSQQQNPLALNGMVTSPHYLATQAGLDILRSGGTAVDAAIAAAATLTVVYPQMCTLGGDNFWLIYNAKDNKVVAINASGRAGEKATIKLYKGKGLDKIPSHGYLAANTVPGVVSGWDKAFKYAKKILILTTNGQICSALL